MLVRETCLNEWREVPALDESGHPSPNIVLVCDDRDEVRFNINVPVGEFRLMGRRGRPWRLSPVTRS